MVTAQQWHRAMYPTCVGMNRRIDQMSSNETNVPHMRGDEPISPFWLVINEQCTPHAWG